MTEQELIILLNEKLCDIADALMCYYDCCSIKDSACKVADPNPCCINSQFGKGLCPFWINNRCNFRHADCKLWICETAIKTTNPKCIEALKFLEQFARLYGIIRIPLIGESYAGADRQPKQI